MYWDKYLKECCVGWNVWWDPVTKSSPSSFVFSLRLRFLQEKKIPTKTGPAQSNLRTETVALEIFQAWESRLCRFRSVERPTTGVVLTRAEYWWRRLRCPRWWLVQKSGDHHHVECKKNPVNNGINRTTYELMQDFWTINSSCITFWDVILCMRVLHDCEYV